ncbi:tail assembly chaperone [Macrococcus capreoli]|uniref:tail assembly chaperone n=1 Tax=Macrococcus capreoli TaxID=2982690 RepID=UPI003EE4C7C6
MTNHFITSLNINGREYEAKGSLHFTKKAKKLAQTDAQRGELGGYKGIYLGLVDEDPEALSNFWRCAIVTGFDEKTIDDAIERKAIELNGDFTPLFRGAVQVMQEDLMLKGFVKKFWRDLEKQADKTKDEQEREDLVANIEQMRENIRELMTVPQEVQL